MRMRIELEYHTLPADHLNLSTKEIGDIIAFMNSLSDYEKFANEDY